jgi:cation transport protein ChaC
MDNENRAGEKNDGDADGGFWVFGYGSLMWRPGFEPVERRMARLKAYRRRFCLSSVHYRGTPEAPGRVLGLDFEPNGACEGVALRVAAETAAETLAYLRERELVSYAYLETVNPVTLEDGRVVDALCYVIDRHHPQYVGGESREEQAALIATREGPAGTNRAYLENTLAHLRELGVRDEELEALAALVAAYPGAAD